MLNQFEEKFRVANELLLLVRQHCGLHNFTIQGNGALLPQPTRGKEEKGGGERGERWRASKTKKKKR